jgi:UDP-N-acetylmuramoyl-tripeptide--D-alanyl-D-alanine ligase
MTLDTLHSLFLSCTGVATDTRKIEDGSLFVALKGDHFDANTFAKEALTNGAKYVVIDNPDYYIDDRTLLVENTLITSRTG